MKKILSILLAGMMILSFSACGKDSSSSNLSSTSVAQADEKEIINREGNKVEVPAEINKIISTSPSNTEILTGLGLGNKIIATDSFSTGIEGLKSGIPTFDMANVDMEQVIALKPDAIFINEISKAGEADKYAPLKDAGINVIYIPAATSLQDIMDDITFISKYTKTSAKGQEFVESIKKSIEDVKSKVALLSSNPPTVYFEVSPAPYLYSTGNGTYINEIIEICGGKNIYADQKGWLSNTDESVLKANPDIIITNCAYDGYSYTEINSRAGWNTINAVKNQKVILVDTNASSRASQNIVKAIQEIAKAIHPEL